MGRSWCSCEMDGSQVSGAGGSRTIWYQARTEKRRRRRKSAGRETRVWFRREHTQEERGKDFEGGLKPG